MNQFLILIVITLVTTLTAQTSFADVNWTRQPRPIIHKVAGDETLWFIAQVYYKKGENYQKIMAANGLKTPESVKQGALLVIPNPLFSNHQKNFQARYDMIHKIREDKLGNLISKALKTKANYQAEIDASIKERLAIEEQMNLKDSEKAKKRGIASENDQQNNAKITDLENSNVRRFVAE